jgi:aldehyde dehydrogenase (NAD+)
LQSAIYALPFGGVGQSGFRMFSHKKAVMKRGYLIELSLRRAGHWMERR